MTMVIMWPNAPIWMRDELRTKVRLTLAIIKFADNDNCQVFIKLITTINRTCLFLVEILQRILEAFFQSEEGEISFNGPPDLDGTQSDLGGRLEDPDFTWFLLVRRDRFFHLNSYRLLHVLQQTIQPNLHLQRPVTVSM